MKVRPTLIMTGLAIILVLISSTKHTVMLVWNRTQSVPKGLYFVHRTAVLERGSLVVYKPTYQENVWLQAGGFIGKDWPMLKHIAGLYGDTICRNDDAILINEVPASSAIETDMLPVWTGCMTLSASQVFLLNEHPRSIDGRYFGPQDTDQIAGTAVPLWTFSE